MARRRQIDYVIHIITPVVNQKEGNSCIKVVLADLTTIIYRMNNDDEDPGLDLSPQIMIDRDGSTHDCVEMCIFDCYGLEKTSVYPWSRIAREEWTEDEYETRPDERYRLQNILYYDVPERIVEMLIHMYTDGFCYPCVGILIMGRFADNDVALEHANGRLPYRHAPDAVLTGHSHALLIVGVNTMSLDEDEHYCLVKNSYGEEWGDHGFSRVGFEVFQQILYPIQPTPEEFKVQADYEAYLRTKEKGKGKVDDCEPSSKNTKGKEKVLGGW